MRVDGQTEVNLDPGIDDSDWLNIKEAASYLRMFSKDGEPCVAHVRNLCVQGRIPFYKPYGRLLFRRSELKRLVASSRKGEARCR